jgi:pimeloyl-ACP methyl ester carboxylesterase
LEYPGRVAGLVVVGAGTNEPAFTDPWMTGLQKQMAEAQQRLDAPAWIDLFLRALVAGPYREPAEVDADVLARCREMVTATVTNHVRPDAVAPHHVTGSWERLGEITVPAMAIYGALDAADHVAMTERFAGAVKGCRLVRIEGAAHMPPMERPDEFNRALLGFLDGAGAGR